MSAEESAAAAERSLRQSFGSDNQAGVHPEIFAALAEANQGHCPSYGGDPWSQRAETLFQREFGPEAQTFFVFNGTAANALALSALAEPYEAILCAQESHAWNDECGAPERWSGAKLIPLPSLHGKLSVEAIEAALVRRGDQHFSQPRALTISQPTELGAVYSLHELATIGRCVREKGLLLHVDGARLVNAAAFLGCSLREAAGDADAISFGGTKNGLMFGEAIVFPKPGTARNFRWRRKQGMQLPSKSRFVAAQFEVLLRDGLWRRIANHSHAQARRLADGLLEAGLEVSRPVESNAVFVRIPKAWLSELRARTFFYVWDERTLECRLMTSFNTEAAAVEAFVAEVRRLQQSAENCRLLQPRRST